jgi:threonine/homoserine/homoserine lactone efflux protein
MSEQVTSTQVVFGAIVIVAVFIVMAATMYFHAQSRAFSEQTISFLKWLIRVLFALFLALVGVSGLRLIGNLLS